MAAIALSGASTPIQQILLITAKSFLIPAQPEWHEPELVLLSGEFKDPMPLRWKQSDGIARLPRSSQTASGSSLLGTA